MFGLLRKAQQGVSPPFCPWAEPAPTTSRGAANLPALFDRASMNG
jgi:hypothetical protein